MEAEGKAKELKRVLETLRNPAEAGPDPKFLLVEERDLARLAESLQHVAEIKNPQTVRDAILESGDYINALIRGVESMTLEEKETLMKELSKLRQKEGSRS